MAVLGILGHGASDRTGGLPSEPWLPPHVRLPPGPRCGAAGDAAVHGAGA